MKKISNWKEIHGFDSLRSYEDFVISIESKINDGSVKEIPIVKSYQKGLLYGGRWFLDCESGEVWRLIEPDFPFRGVWEPVDKMEFEFSGIDKDKSK